MVTLQISAIVVVIALVLGVLFGTALTYAPWWVAWPVRAYSDIARGLPLITLIFFVYYAHAGAEGECQRLVGGGRRTALPSRPPMSPR